MKAICLATLMTVVLFAVVTVALRHFPSEHRVRRTVGLYLACLLGLTAVWLASPDDLWILSRRLLAEPKWFDLALSLGFFSAAFFGGILQLYNLADRGFSLRLLIDILENPGGAAARDSLMVTYGGGSGLAWMYRKRLEGLLDHGLVQRHGPVIALTAKGIRVASLFLWARRLFKLGTIP